MRWIAFFILNAILLGTAYEGAYSLFGNEPFSVKSALIRGCIFSAAMMMAAFWIQRVKEK